MKAEDALLITQEYEKDFLSTKKANRIIKKIDRNIKRRAKKGYYYFIYKATFISNQDTLSIGQYYRDNDFSVEYCNRDFDLTIRWNQKNTDLSIRPNK